MALGIVLAVGLLVTLGAAEELWHMCGDYSWPAPMIVRGLAPSPVKRHKVALVNCSCH